MEFPRRRYLFSVAFTGRQRLRLFFLLLICLILCGTTAFSSALLALTPEQRYQDSGSEETVVAVDVQAELLHPHPSVDTDGVDAQTALLDAPSPTETTVLTPTQQASVTPTDMQTVIPDTATVAATETPDAANTPWPTSVPETVTSLPTATEASTHTPTYTPAVPATMLPPTASNTPTLEPTPTTAELPTPVPPVPTPPLIFISEFLANPEAVGDSVGEFIELHNAGDLAIDLNGWHIADRDSDRHTIVAELLSLPGQYLVLGRNNDPASNGGVPVDYVYESGMQLANGADEIVLISSTGVEVDAVEWIDGDISSGASLERTVFDETGAWTTAHITWAGSAGDFGSPMAPYTLPPKATATPTATLHIAPTLTPTIVATDMVTVTATPTLVATEAATLIPITPIPITPIPITPIPVTPIPITPIPVTPIPVTPIPAVYISEFMADPSAVSDTDGEFIELYNAHTDTVNLSGWILADLGTNHHAIGQDLLIPPGGYAVLAVNGNATINGALAVDYVYHAYSLSNGNDEILLLSPGQEEADRVAWGDGTGLNVTMGSSLERTSFDETGTWMTASRSWPGSAGDFGSPGSMYEMLLPTPVDTPTPADASTPVPIAPSDIYISEFMANPQAVDDADGEYIEIFNADNVAISLKGWQLADLGSERHTIGANLIIQPNQYVILGRNDNMAENGGLPVDYVYSGFTLANSEDEILLQTSNGQTIDQVAWGEALIAVGGASLERIQFSEKAQWAVASRPWPNSTGDFGSPLAPYVPPIATATPVPLTATPKPTETATTIPPEPTPQPWSGPIPPIYLSEFLADPNAVNDADGEFVELFNGHSQAVNLRGWILADLGSNRHVINQDVMIPAGGYFMLAINDDQLTNGGLAVDYVYNSFSLANTEDEIILLAPNEEEVDRVSWGDATGRTAKKGVSYERTAFDATGTWVAAATPWHSSAGDLGSPGQMYDPSTIPILVPTPTPATTSVPPASTPLPWSGPVPPIYISEFMADPDAINDADGEYIELFNSHNQAVNLRGWILADLGSNRHVIEQDVIVQPGDYTVLAVNGEHTNNGGLNVDYVHKSYNLSNNDDEIVLLAPNEEEADRVIWGTSTGLETKKGFSLERTGFGDAATWVIAHSPWPGSVGDLGSPGRAFSPAPPDMNTPSPAPLATDEPPGSLPPWRGPIPPIYISEFLADPDAVNDADGEFVELFNNHNQSVNLRGWILTDLGSNRHVINEDAVVPPGSYIVLAVNDDRSTNGGFIVDYVYSGYNLSNGDDEILLLAPNEEEADRVIWGNGTGLGTTKGASLERISFASDALWVTSYNPWPGSAGDRGSPGRAYTSPPPGSSTPVPVPTNDLVDPSPPPWNGPVPPVHISEFLANPNAVNDADGEYIELFNNHSQSVNLFGWILADLGSNRHVIDTDVTIPAGGHAVLAISDDVSANGGLEVDYVYSSYNLSNGDDEILLLTPNEQEVDRVMWGNDTGLGTSKGASLERVGFDGNETWVTAQGPWLGSAGDWGSPGRDFTPQLPGVNTPLPAATSTPAGTTPPWDGPAAPVYISEFLADPNAVNDADGEFVELFNGHNEAVNLFGWILADLGSNRHVINDNVSIPAGGFAILAINGDPSLNGGFKVDYVYRSYSLANAEDEIVLLAPNEEEVDRVVWGDGADLQTTNGASLERTSYDVTGRWIVATTVWPGSAGDFGSPTQAFDPSTPPILVPTPTPIVPELSTPTPLPSSGELPDIRFNEVMANPDAVADSAGEFIELFNAGDTDVNLRGWQLTDLGNDLHVIDTDVLIVSGGFALLGRNADFALNGGISPDYVWSGLNLANDADEVVLVVPDGREVDRLLWGEADQPSVTRGASLERVDSGEKVVWVVAQDLWSGSAGDLGSPGMANRTTAIPEPGSTPVPASTVVPTPVSGKQWPSSTHVDPLQIDEVGFRGSAEEFVVLRNVSDGALSLDGWAIGDAESPGDGESIYALPADVVLPAGERFVVARNAVEFRALFGQMPDVVVEESGMGVTLLSRRLDLAPGQLALSDSGDEVVLLNPQMAVADSLAYKKGDKTSLGLVGDLAPESGFSLQRVPSTPFNASIDQRHRYLYARPSPFHSIAGPQIAPMNAPNLQGELLAVWGTLGGASNFSEGHSAPPGYLLAAAAAQGLHFMAIADPADADYSVDVHGIVQVPAWRWYGDDDEDEAAIVYSAKPGPSISFDDLEMLLKSTSSSAAWLGRGPVPSEHYGLVSGTGISAPGSLKAMVERWHQAGRPLLPAGNSNPFLPGENDPAPRYTGLAVTDLSSEAILEAVRTRRGWLTNRPGLWLSMRTTVDGTDRWMGTTMTGANQRTIHVEYGDSNGEAAGLAIWQNGRPIHHQDAPSNGGVWSVTLPAIPGATLFAVATQADGDFAVTAPFQIPEEDSGTVQISEVMPSPAYDYNGDGLLDNDDEYVELYNPGAIPVLLEGWQLTDRRGDENDKRRFTFGDGQFISGGDRLVLLHSETYINLDDDDDYVRLLDADGDEVDSFGWHLAPSGGSYSRPPDETNWQTDTVPTPGETYDGRHGTGTVVEEKSDPTEGQAGGLPGSVAAAKRQGLERWVEFQATVVVPPGLFNSAIYVADASGDRLQSGIGIQVYLRNGEFPPLAVGDRVLVRGLTQSFRGEMEVFLEDRTQIWRIEGGAPLQPLSVSVSDINESLEGRLIALEGVVSGWQGSSIYFGDPNDASAEPIRVTVRSSLDWKRPYVNEGERFQIIGIVSQFAKEAPWNDGYRVMVRFPSDLVQISE